MVSSSTHDDLELVDMLTLEVDHKGWNQGPSTRTDGVQVTLLPCSRSEPS